MGVSSLGHTGLSSSDDSANSECSDHRLQEALPLQAMARRSQRGLHRRKPWRPIKHRLIPPQLGADWSPTDAIRTREARQYESYLGHPVPPPTIRDNTLRVATININKITKTKLYAELSDWFIAHQLDFAILADADIGTQPHQIWCTQTNGSMRPGLVTLGTSRVAILYDYQRIAIHFRLGHRGKLTLLGAYCPDSPHTCRAETQQEWDWLAEHTPPPTPRTLVLLAGDFNTYGTNPMDRSSTAQRSKASVAIGEAYDSWQQLHNWTSTFRQLHPQLPRYTYARAGTAVALDDILIQTNEAHCVTASGIWIGSLHSSDHIGIPIAEIALNLHWTSSSQLKEVCPIRVVNTRKSTPTELAQFTTHTTQLVQTLQLPPLIPPLADTEDDPATISHWLETAMHNLYTILYGSAKSLWGETSQTQRAINRATAIKRSNRCMAQWRYILRLLADQELSIPDIIRLADGIQWPKWVRDPTKLPKEAPHSTGALTLHHWWIHRPTDPHALPGQWRMWLLTGWTHWHQVYKSQRRWRSTAQRLFAQRYRTELFMGKHTRQFLQNALGRPTPPISIRSTMVDQPDGTRTYSENKADVTAALQKLLDNWIPPAERTERPAHLSTLSANDLPQAPRFVREWLLHDMHRPEHIAPGFLHNDQCTWDTYVYTHDMQQTCDRYLRKHVAPGYGGVSQELWIAAPPAIRARERLIINTILRTGCVPPCLGRKQMLYIAKSATAHGIVNHDAGLPPWRPITVQNAFTSRLFMVIRDYITPIIPNEPLQHGFQKDRTVQDAVILTSLLIDRAQQTNSELFLTSKDCLKCFDRVPSWVMEYVYLKLGVPPTPRKLMAHFLGASVKLTSAQPLAGSMVATETLD
ncbi:hypothetical protein Ae201684P_016934 [Aphanomyces euteiches]|uniref:Reverse transcriptase domain-containing protein n=1 Tax=Aphanomyces euteiches TaxID=100861 RepID=A0A6G0XIT6_9STRA|nr:hypothetical protein Ae201684_004263 [Aphanomyces euteiches]KAH9094324.1 hypothetical protein Ae201684P_016934 [Aphanomyces euteiches]